ncbi:MAG: hypothetical protein MRY83_07490 [Flavobacteriales bacterium]|nr:hypothetical protein [Flavobacteriales bacterium]
MDSKCMRCGSNDIVKKVRAADIGRKTTVNLSLEAYKDPDALFFPGKHRAPLKADVCVKCGYVSFSISVEDAIIIKELQKNVD